ncbi:MAG TPA: PKD domain-containing protein [Puia sp.]|nr:PKD domain-containing protein [Puia sp.]
MIKKTFIAGLLWIAAVLPGYAQDEASNIEFVENKGQWDPRVDFKGEMMIGAFFLQKKGFTVLLHNADDLARMSGAHHGMLGPVPGGDPGGGGVGKGQKAATSTAAAPSTSGAPPGGGIPGDILIHSHAYTVTFLGANPEVVVIPDKSLPSYNNYFIGHDPSKWASHCRIFQGVTYKNIYPNIDVRYYSDKGQLKYDIIVHPGGDVNQIALRYEGADKLSTKKGQLIVGTSVGEVKELAPYSYLFNEKGKTEISSKFTIKDGNTVRFKVAEHDPGSTLIIDPSLVFCTFTGSKVSNWGFTATPGPDGSFFAGGIVFGGAFPYNTGALQPNYGGGQFDVGIMKFSSNGANKVYATYIGGNDSETPHSMICDAQGNLIVLGRTYSSDFPYKTTAGPGGAADMFVAKLDASGSVLIGCMRIGGTGNDCANMQDQLRNLSEKADSLVRNYGDDSRSEVVLDASNNILVAANTQSSSPAGHFPIVGAVFQPNFGGGRQDGVVLKIDPACDHLIWSSYLGGSGSDAAFVLKADPVNGDIYVGGATTSTDFPGNKSGVIQAAYSGGACDGFVTVISSDGATQRKTSYFGTSAADAIYGIQVDKKGFPYIMGTTNGTWPVTPNVTYFTQGAKQFVSKLEPDLSAYVYSTTFGLAARTGPGGNFPNISPVAFLVDRCENVYVSGWGGWILPGQADPYGLSGTLGMPTTPDAIKKQTDNRDFYFIVLKKNSSALLYGTFYGQDDNGKSISEHVDGGTSRYDQNGIIYQAICANCNGGTTKPFPTTPGVWSPRNGAGTNGCNLAAVKISFNFAGVAAGLKASVNGRDNDTAGCVPMDVVFQDTIRNAKSYIWNFGDGGPDTSTVDYAVSHTYPLPGRYRVMMVAIDSNSCNGRDTSYRTVIARTDRALMDFGYEKVGDCQSLNYQFTNLSKAPATKPFGDSSFVWSFSDHTGNIPAGPVTSTLDYSFKAPGTYIVKLILVDTGYCNYPDTVTKTIRVSPLTKAQFVTPATGCAPYTAIIDNTSLGGLQFAWDFGDGTTSTDPVPTHLYPNPGSYTIKLVVTDTTTCNKTDATQQTILVSGRPTAGFSYGPNPPVANTPIIFTNTSSPDGVRFVWDFGDGDSTVQTSLDTTRHLYNSTDTFQVCLMAFNQYGCSDTLCKPVATLIHPLLDVPNAFTPGRFGQNGIVKVMGFGITHLVFRIYNRWGQMVFQSNDPDLGWNGTYQGNLQPLGVYAYTLEAEFSNGTRVNKKGDITLIR